MMKSSARTDTGKIIDDADAGPCFSIPDHDDSTTLGQYKEKQTQQSTELGSFAVDNRKMNHIASL
jgi:hypothetical protein